MTTFGEGNIKWHIICLRPFGALHNLCTSLMIYMTFVIQNNLCAPMSNNFNGEVAANVNNAFNYIHWVKDFLDNTHN